MRTDPGNTFQKCKEFKQMQLLILVNLMIGIQDKMAISKIRIMLPTCI